MNFGRKQTGGSLILGLATLALVACGGGSSATSYSKSYNKTADFATECYHAGYLAAVLGENATYAVTLTINGSNYQLVKEIKADPNAPTKEGLSTKYHLVFDFSGTCEVNGSKVKISIPTKCVWEEDWAGLNEYGALTSGKGTATSADDVTENGDSVFGCVMGEFINPTTPAEQSITLNGSSLSFDED